MKRFRNLTLAQLRAFEAIAINQDASFRRAQMPMLKRLEADGLIVNTPQDLGYIDETQIVLHSYSVPPAIHAEWCAWCAENVDVEA